MSDRIETTERSCGKSAFTLIELLVVVSIIALLLSILLPSLNAARSQAKKTVCASNMRQIQIAIHSYINEERGCVPYVHSPMVNTVFRGMHPSANEDCNPFLKSGTIANKDFWPQSLPNVMMPRFMDGDTSVFVCPSAIDGWPRDADDLKYTIRPASINQVNNRIEKEGTYLREGFGFMDGRVFWDFKREATDDPMLAAYQELFSLGAYVRDLIVPNDNNASVKGPHDGGTLLINRMLEVEYRDEKKTNEFLAPNGMAGAQF